MSRNDEYYKNGSGYNDPTAGKALSSFDKMLNNKADNRVKEIRKTIEDFCEAAGFELLEPITLRDKFTNKCYY